MKIFGSVLKHLLRMLWKLDIRYYQESDLRVQLLEEEHDSAGAVVGGDGRGAQLEDVAAVVHVDGAGLAGGQGHDGLEVWRLLLMLPLMFRCLDNLKIF